MCCGMEKEWREENVKNSIIYNVCVVVWRRVNRGCIYRKGTKKFAEGLESA